MVTVVSLSESPEVVAVIATLARDRERVIAAIRSVREQVTTRTVAILCIVNARDAAELADEPGVTTIVAGVNLGFGGAAVFARSLVGDAYLWLVQDDMVAPPHSLELQVAALEADPTLGAVGPIVVDANGLVPRGSCGAIVDADGSLHDWYPAADTAPGDLTELDRLGYLPSRGLIIHTSAWDDAGGMDAMIYPVQYSDVDLSMRLRSIGRGFRMLQSVAITHTTNGSTPISYAHFLHDRNGRRVRERWFPDGAAYIDAFMPVDWARPAAATLDAAELDPRIPADLIAQILTASTETLAQLGRVFGAERERLQLEARDAREAIQETTRRLQAASSQARNAAARVAEQQIELERVTDHYNRSQQHNAELATRIGQLGTRLEALDERLRDVDEDRARIAAELTAARGQIRKRGPRWRRG